MRFTNLLTEMARKNITQKQIAKVLKIEPATLSKKINFKTDFTLPEIKLIRDYIDPELKLEFLFSIEE